MVHPFAGAGRAEDEALHAAADAAERTALETPIVEVQRAAEHAAARVLQEHGLVPVDSWFETYTHLGVLIVAQRKRLGSSPIDECQRSLF
jgi:hypothetical protein